MTKEEQERLETIERLLMKYTKIKNDSLKDNDMEKAEIYKQALLRLDREKWDILEGRKEIMDARREELLEEADQLNIEYLNSTFIRKKVLERKIKEVYDQTDEFSLRRYAKAKIKEKTIDK